MSPGETLRARIREDGISVTAAAERLGVTAHHLYRILRGVKVPGLPLATKIERCYRTPRAGDWLSVEGRP